MDQYRYLWAWIHASYEELLDAGIQFPEDFIETAYPAGTRFDRMDDNRPWYVVGYQDDGVRVKDGGKILLITIKAWNKAERGWEYETTGIHWFLLSQGSMCYDEEKYKHVPLREHAALLDARMRVYRADKEKKNKTNG